MLVKGMEMSFGKCLCEPCSFILEMYSNERWWLCFRKLWMCVNTTCQTFKQCACEDGCFFWVWQLPTITWESFEGSVLFTCFLFIPMNGNKILKEFRKGFARKAFYREHHIEALIERPWISHTYRHWDDNHHHTKKKKSAADILKSRQRIL